MMAAGIAHYWSVEQFMVSLPETPIRNSSPAMLLESPPVQLSESPLLVVHRDTSRPIPAPSSDETNVQTEVLQEMLAQLKTLKTENNDLLDQLAETNRDVMKLQFQVDSHSEDFRPLPIPSEREIQRASYPPENDPGVLPPRAMPVYPLEE